VTSFRVFLTTDDARHGRDPEFLTRLARSASSINSLNALLRWSKERYPTDYSPEDWRKTNDAPNGRDAMRHLWATYLQWREGNATEGVTLVDGPVG
jgi:hypothetical protein